MNTPIFKDKKGLIAFCSILQIVFAVLFFAFTALMIFVLFLPTAQDSQNSLNSLIPAACLYSGIGFVFLVLGIGSLRVKSWARSLSQILYGALLGIGVLALVVIVLLDFSAMNQVVPNEQATYGPGIGNFMIVLKMILFVLALLFFVLLPGLLFLVYRSRNVKATFAHHDPKPNWTDQQPLPILALTLFLFFWGVAQLFIIPSKHIPFLGLILSGVVNWIYAIVSGASFCAASWLVFKQKKHAWTITAAISVLFKTLPVVSLLMTDMTEYYRILIAAGKVSAQISPEQMANFWHSSHFAGILLFWMLIELGFVFYTRRYFSPQAR